MSKARLDIEIVGGGRDLVLLHFLLSDRSPASRWPPGSPGATPRAWACPARAA